MNKINGIDISEPVLTATNNDVYYSQNAVDELLNKIKHLQEENEELKEYIKDLQERKDKYYLKTLDYEAKISYLIQALEEIRKIISSVKNEYMNTKNKELALYHTELNGALSVAESIEGKINEVLNDRD